MKTIIRAESPHRRIFPTGNFPGGQTGGTAGRRPRFQRSIRIDAARNESVSFQVAVSVPGEPTRRTAAVSTGELRDAKQETAEISIVCESSQYLKVRVRRVGFVPVLHHNTVVDERERDGVGHIPGYVPDPLYEERQTRVPVGETVSFWITVSVSRAAPPGIVTLPVFVYIDGKPAAGGPVGGTPPAGGPVGDVRADIHIYDTVLEKRKNFPVTHWFYNDALLDWYGFQAFEEGFWQILPAYIRNCVEHGQDTLYLPVFTPPLDGVKRPTQLLKVFPTGKSDGRQYRFDWKDVKRYVDLAKRCGIRFFEWTHLFQQWGCEYAIRIYKGQGVDEKLLWKPTTGAVSGTYRGFLAEFLPELKRFLDREKLLNRSFFHVSDEPHADEHLNNYKKARGLLGSLAPWMTTMDAVSEIVYGRQHVTDMPIPTIRVVRDFVEEGIPCWTYFCCGPRGPYLNRLMDTPLSKVRMAGWLFYRFGVRGFLHWGYNYWYECQSRNLIDPFCESSGKKWPSWAYGDPFVVYPGKSGPIDSIRWEVFSASLQDYSLLQKAGTDPNGKLLQPLEDFHKFPKDEEWWISARRAILRAASAS